MTVFVQAGARLRTVPTMLWSIASNRDQRIWPCEPRGSEQAHCSLLHMPASQQMSWMHRNFCGSSAGGPGLESNIFAGGLQPGMCLCLGTSMGSNIQNK